jgi:uncharacterized protein YjbI with pentapeptide repeats
MDIKNCHRGEVIYSGKAETIAKLLEQAVKEGVYLDRANLEGANLKGANLDGAILEGANLKGANLDGAILEGANLDGAILEGANLYRANLDGANLYRANLKGANLDGAILEGANLDGAILSDKTIIETRETWKQYLAEVVPALLTAGGRELKQVLKPEHWNCHSWENCPMAVAFNTTGITGIPVLLRPRADQFIRYFDAGVIPLEAVGVGLRALAP